MVYCCGVRRREEGRVGGREGGRGGTKSIRDVRLLKKEEEGMTEKGRKKEGGREGGRERGRRGTDSA